MIARIGRDDLSATALWATAVSAWTWPAAGGSRLNSYPVASFSDSRRMVGGRVVGPQVLDVRHRHEWQAGHLSGARHWRCPS